MKWGVAWWPIGGGAPGGRGQPCPAPTLLVRRPQPLHGAKDLVCRGPVDGVELAGNRGAYKLDPLSYQDGSGSAGWRRDGRGPGRDSRRHHDRASRRGTWGLWWGRERPEAEDTGSHSDGDDRPPPPAGHGTSGNRLSSRGMGVVGGLRAPQTRRRRNGKRLATPPTLDMAAHVPLVGSRPPHRDR